MNNLVLTWAPYCRRSQSLADELGAGNILVYYFGFQRKKYAPFKYPLQLIKTFYILIKERPELIVAVAPPILCPLVAYLFCLVFQRRLIIDAHTGAFIDARKFEIYILKKITQYVDAVVVTNDELAKIVKSWKGKPCVLEDPPINRKKSIIEKPLDGFNVLVINTFSPDEPIREILSAAKKSIDANFYITGDKGKASEKLIKNVPSNVKFTGFIPDNEYWKLIDSCDIAICLTTRNHTLLCGAYEAIYSDKPLITSDFKVLKNYFSFGSIYVENTAESIFQGIICAREQLQNLRSEIKAGKDEMKKKWHLKLKRIRRQLEF